MGKLGSAPRARSEGHSRTRAASRAVRPRGTKSGRRRRRWRASASRWFSVGGSCTPGPLADSAAVTVLTSRAAVWTAGAATASVIALGVMPGIRNINSVPVQSPPPPPPPAGTCPCHPKTPRASVLRASVLRAHALVTRTHGRAQDVRMAESRLGRDDARRPLQRPPKRSKPPLGHSQRGEGGGLRARRSCREHEHAQHRRCAGCRHKQLQP